MSSTRSWRPTRSWTKLPAWAALAVLGSGMLITGNVLDVGAVDDPVPVLIRGSGDSDTIAELVTWQNTMFAATQPTDVGFSTVGSKLGRQNLLAGRVEFAVSGVPFTASELAGRPAGAGEIIEIPISVGSYVIIMTTPTNVNGAWDTQTIPPAYCDDPDDPRSDGPECIAVVGTFTGPWRIPPENLSGLMLGLPYSASNNLVSWKNPAWAAVLGTSSLKIQGGNGRVHTFVNRTDASTQNMILMRYAKAMGPVAWATRIATNPEFPWEPIGENFSSRVRPTKPGTDQQLAVVALRGINAVSGDSSGDVWSGNMGAIPATMLPKALLDYPKALFVVAEIQNKHGDWLKPTKTSLDAALAAGTTPNVAATQDVPGAYPLTFINHLYTVAGTLTPDRANALAATIRYIVTDGQQPLLDGGGTSLPASLQAQALAAADQIVIKNCSDPAYEVTASGPSGFEPNTPKVQALTSLRHCTLRPPPATTTTLGATTTSPPPTTVESTTSSPPATATPTTGPPTTAASTTEPPATTPAVVTTTTQIASLPAFDDDGGGPGNTALPQSLTPATYNPPAFSPPAFTPAAAGSPATTPSDVAGLADATTETTGPAESVPDEVVDTTVPVLGTETSLVGGGGGARPRGVSLTALPMDRPDDGAEGFKKLGTLCLGAALFLFARRLVLARRPAT